MGYQNSKRKYQIFRYISSVLWWYCHSICDCKRYLLLLLCYMEDPSIYIYIYIPCLFLLDELCIFSLYIKDLAYTTHITGRSQFLNRISGTNNKKRLQAGQRLQRECAWVIGYNITQHKPNSTIVGWIMDGHGVFRTWTFCFIFYFLCLKLKHFVSIHFEVLLIVTNGSIVTTLTLIHECFGMFRKRTNSIREYIK